MEQIVHQFTLAVWIDTRLTVNRYNVARQEIKAPRRSHRCSVCGKKFRGGYLLYSLKQDNEDNQRGGNYFYAGSSHAECVEKLETRVAAFIDFVGDRLYGHSSYPYKPIGEALRRARLTGD